MRRWVRPLVATSLALTMTLVASTPAQAVSREGTWRGPTSQGYNIRFRVNPAQQITFVTFTVFIDGAFCEGPVTWSATGRFPIRADDTFVVRGRDGIDSFLVKGEFVARNRAKGILKSSTITGCIGSGRATWVATRT